MTNPLEPLSIPDEETVNHLDVSDKGGVEEESF